MGPGGAEAGVGGGGGDGTSSSPGWAEDGIVRYTYLQGGGIELSKAEARRLRRHEVEQVVASKKMLFLVLDLDHTVLNSARASEVGAEAAGILGQRLEAQASRTRPGELPADGLFHLPHINMFTKLRPYVRDFLREAAKLYRLYVYTMGERGYALEMAKLLDPEENLFPERVISANDSSHRRIKDLDIVLGGEWASTCVIMDDTVDVWPSYKENVLLVDRYHYFPSSIASFGLIGRDSLLEAGRDERAEDGMLARCLSALRRIHSEYFARLQASNADKEEGETDIELPDIRDIMRMVKADILRGVVILFTRVIPRDASDPSAHRVWQLAVSLGAEVAETQDERVTHVVAGAPGTHKQLWGAERGKRVVTVHWLEACAMMWARLPESSFKVVRESEG